MNLRWYQLECIQHLLAYRGSNNPICVLPTGTGKSVIIAEFIRQVLVSYNNVRVLMLTHVGELVAQNAEKMRTIWPTCPLGIYSDSLKRKDEFGNVIYGTVQSVIKPVLSGKMGTFSIVVVDECHMISDKETTQYRRLIDELLTRNPNLLVVGFTATPYRMNGGSLLNTGIFGEILYDLSEPEQFLRLIEEGYLSPLMPKAGAEIINTDDVKITSGDFNKKELASLTDSIEKNETIVKDIIHTAHVANRKSWLIFATSVEHCEHLKELMLLNGVVAETCHSRKSRKENDDILNRFKNGDITCVINNDKLTTGFDNPRIDLLGIVRATKSKGLWIQILGRGTRVHPDKDYCLVLDYTNNTRDLGPINQKYEHVIAGKSTKKPTGEAVMKICPRCECYNYASSRICGYCGHEFPFDEMKNVHSQVSNLTLIETKIENDVEMLKIDNVFYSQFKSVNKTTPVLRVTYFSGLKKIDEYVCIEHEGYAKRKAIEWWNLRQTSESIKPTVRECLEVTNTLKKPLFINVRKSGKYYEILGVTF